MPRIVNRYKCIPEVRRDLLEIADDPRVPEEIAVLIRRSVRQMYRRKAIRKTPIRSAKMTPAKRKEIHDLFMSTDLSHQQIGDQCHVNTGRVSETVAGFR